jgi:hypothetical protein
MLRSCEQWESDRGVRVEIYAVSGRTVVYQFVGTTLGCIALDCELFQRIFRTPVGGAPERPPLPNTRRPSPARQPVPLGRRGARI